MENKKLNERELLFCELFVTGDAPFAGNATMCYKEAFCDNSKHVRTKALKLLDRPEIQKKMAELEPLKGLEAKAMKGFLTANLMHIVEECSVNSFRDKYGTELSPASLRGVAVSASKALMEMHPVKEAQVNKVSIDGAGKGGITFNVIVPSHGPAEPQIESE